MSRERPALNLPVIPIEFEKRGDSYVVYSLAGMYQAATQAIGYGVCKVLTTCTTIPTKDCPHVMAFAKHSSKTYWAVATSNQPAKSVKQANTVLSPELAALLRTQLR